MPEREDDADDTVIRPRRRDFPVDSPDTYRTDEELADSAEATVIRLVAPPTPRSRDSAVSASALVESLLPVQPAAGRHDSPDRTERGAASPTYTLRIPGVAEPVPLDRPAVIGRRPGESRIPEAQPPRTIVVPPHCREVSSRHARIEQVGLSVLVTDLGSSNGIDVHLSTGTSQRLRPGESSVVLPGSVISLGDGIDITLLTAATQPPRSQT
jgi:hypothetical protein